MTASLVRCLLARHKNGAIVEVLDHVHRIVKASVIRFVPVICCENKWGKACKTVEIIRERPCASSVSVNERVNLQVLVVKPRDHRDPLNGEEFAPYTLEVGELFHKHERERGDVLVSSTPSSRDRYVAVPPVTEMSCGNRAFTFLRLFSHDQRLRLLNEVRREKNFVLYALAKM